jgi:hypothetical protein
MRNVQYSCVGNGNEMDVGRERGGKLGVFPKHVKGGISMQRPP